MDNREFLMSEKTTVIFPINLASSKHLTSFFFRWINIIFSHSATFLYTIPVVRNVRIILIFFKCYLFLCSHYSLLFSDVWNSYISCIQQNDVIICILIYCYNKYSVYHIDGRYIYFWVIIICNSLKCHDFFQAI